MLAENIGRIGGSRDVGEALDASRDGFTCAVVGQCIVAFVETGVWSLE